MYKVFFNQKPIILTTSLVEQTQESPVFFLKFAHKKSIITALKSKKVKQLYLYHAKEEKMWQLFYNLFKVIEAAGGIVQHRKTKKFLFIYRNNKWDIPKGRIEQDESVRAAGIREVEEETGVENLSITKSLPTTLHMFHRNGKYRLKKTYWYAMETDFEGALQPQEEEGIQKAEWVKKDKVSALFKNAYANIQLLWDMAKL
ncbi:MAG: NUDIX domain-containing protein [Candidatus Arcticimaribacter sp.]